MEIIDANSKLLSNYDVYTLLKSVQDELRSKKRSSKNHGLSTVVYECVKALEATPCTSQNEGKVKEFLKRIEEANLGLTKAEKLQLLNSAPKNPVELQLLIEEFVERLKETDEDLLLNIVAETIGTPVVAAAPEGAEDEAQEESGEDSLSGSGAEEEGQGSVT